MHYFWQPVASSDNAFGTEVNIYEQEKLHAQLSWA